MYLYCIHMNHCICRFLKLFVQCSVRGCFFSLMKKKVKKEIRTYSLVSYGELSLDFVDWGWRSGWIRLEELMGDG